MWLYDRSQGLASIVFSCFTLPMIKRPSPTSGKKRADRTEPCGHFDTLDQDEIETNVQLVIKGLTGLNVSDVANGTMMVASMHPKNTSYLTF